MNTIWHQNIIPPSFPTLKDSIRTDTAIIGGGLCGILTAFYLNRIGIDCVVLEAETIGSGQTAGTTAKITAQHGLCYHNLIQSHGKASARIYALACQTAVSEYESLIQKERISCDFRRCPSYIYSTQENTLFLMAEANDALSLGLDAAYTDELSLPFPITGAVRFERQACFHPLRFLYAIAEKLQIFEHSRVLHIDPPSGKKGDASADCSILHTENGKITANHVIFACHYPFLRYPGFYFLRMYQKQNPMLALRSAPLPSSVCLGIDPDGLSFRSAGEYLLLGGSNYRSGDASMAAATADILVEKARKYYPESEIAAHWTAQDCVTADGLPYIGAFAKNRPGWYLADGFGKWGMTGSLLSAALLSDLLTGRDNPLEELLSPERFLRHASASFLAEHVSQSVNHLVLARFKKPAETTDDLEKDEGGIVLHHGKKAAAYRNADGCLYTFIPKCPHMGCELTWNRAAKTFDCPCHGSRFCYDGKLLCGPANLSLKALDDEKK